MITQNIVTIIPARGGSKGIPNKNIISFCGRPLLAWSILQARACSRVSSVWVTSDSQEILDIAQYYGASPILRPPSISGDMATSESAWAHALEYIESTQTKVDIVVALQATSPLRSSDDIGNSITLLLDKSADSLLSVVEIEDFFMWHLSNESPESINYDYRFRKPRQLIDKKYLENGSIYLFKPDILKMQGNRLGGKIVMFVMDKYKMFQIDSHEDFELCSNLMSAFKLNMF